MTFYDLSKDISNIGEKKCMVIVGLTAGLPDAIAVDALAVSGSAAAMVAG
jgi:hypothetical protein